MCVQNKNLEALGQSFGSGGVDVMLLFLTICHTDSGP